MTARQRAVQALLSIAEDQHEPASERAFAAEAILKYASDSYDNPVEPEPSEDAAPPSMDWGGLKIVVDDLGWFVAR